jgi:hypothetical protein
MTLMLMKLTQMTLMHNNIGTNNSEKTKVNDIKRLRLEKQENSTML